MSDKVLMMKLYEKTSAKGTRYFAGRLGAARVVAFLDHKAAADCPVWNLYVQGGEGLCAGEPGAAGRWVAVLGKASPPSTTIDSLTCCATRLVHCKFAV